MEISKKGKRPEFKDNIPGCFQKLIKMCWSQLPKDRPSFKTIVEQLKSDPNFITKDVEKDDYYKYIEFIDESQSTFDSTKKIIHISDYIQSKNKTFQKVKIKKHKKKKEEDIMQKITEEEKIVEKDDEIDETILKIISPLVFKKLN